MINDEIILVNKRTSYGLISKWLFIYNGVITEPVVSCSLTKNKNYQRSVTTDNKIYITAIVDNKIDM